MKLKIKKIFFRDTNFMLDTRCSLVLKCLEKECKNGGYNIVEKSDIISALPAKFRCEIDELDDITSFLERNDFISIKYDDESVYCVCVLPKLFDEDKEKSKSLPWLVFFLAFLGAFLGGIIIKLLPF